MQLEPVLVRQHTPPPQSSGPSHVSSKPAHVRGLEHVPLFASIEFKQQTSGAAHEHVGVPGHVTACAAAETAHDVVPVGAPFALHPAAIVNAATSAARAREKIIWCSNR